MTQPKCSAKTAKGTLCQRWAVRGSTTCQAHGGARHKPNDIIGKALDGIEKPRCRYTKRNGEQCRNSPIKGGTVCKKHGGAAAHIQRKAKERLLYMVEPALVELNKILVAPGTSDGDKLRAVSMVLDRTGFGKGITVEHTQDKPWELTMQTIVTTLPDDYAEFEDIEDAEIVREESTGPVEDYSARAQFDGPVIGPTGGGRARVIGSADPPKRRSPHAYDED